MVELLGALAGAELVVIVLVLAALLWVHRRAQAVQSELLDRLMSRTWTEYRVLTDKPIPAPRKRRVLTDEELAARERGQREEAGVRG